MNVSTYGCYYPILVSWRVNWPASAFCVKNGCFNRDLKSNTYKHVERWKKLRPMAEQLGFFKILKQYFKNCIKATMIHNKAWIVQRVDELMVASNILFTLSYFRRGIVLKCLVIKTINCVGELLDCHLNMYILSRAWNNSQMSEHFWLWPVQFPVDVTRAWTKT